jgi:anti-anti-sigma factor
MTDCILREENGVTWIAPQGRLDSMTSPQVQQQIDQQIMDGKRLLVVDFSDVGFVSSAGLRIFMMAQKQLKKVGGEIIFYGIAEALMQVFTMSGFASIFRMCATRQEIAALLAPDQSAAALLQQEHDGMRFSYFKTSCQPGVCFAIGTQDKFAQSRYEFPDSIPVKQSDIRFGAGLAAVGDEYEEYKNFFGEAVVINRSLFFYPAVMRPAVDFILCGEQDSAMNYRFLHGFGFNGQFAVISSFESIEGFITLDSLTRSLFTLTMADAIGIVLLAESKGLLGMNLKKAPIYENKPKNGLDIFDAANFSEWMNFPIEPTDFNTIIAGAGIVVRSREGLASKYEKLLSKESLHHIHGGVFAREPLDNNPAQFEAELKRVVTELEASKVQHVLGQSKFSSGLVGIIEL